MNCHVMRDVNGDAIYVRREQPSLNKGGCLCYAEIAYLPKVRNFGKSLPKVRNFGKKGTQLRQVASTLLRQEDLCFQRTFAVL